MEFLEFEGMTGILNKNHENGFRPLPYHHDKQTGEWMICCAPSDEEIEWLLKNRKFWFKIVCGDLFYPVLPIMQDVRFYQVFDGCEIPYEFEESKHRREVLFIWVSGPISDLPPSVMVAGKVYQRSAKWDIQYVPNKQLDIDDLYFRLPSPEEAAVRAQNLEDQARNLKTIPEDNMKKIIDNIWKNTFKFPVLVRKLQAGKEEILS